jgi:hypothetical protein
MPMSRFSSMFDRSALPAASDFYPVNLKKFRRTGRHKAVALCPFHSDHNPSLSIDLDRGFFHCFGCGAGGDITAFVMLREKLDFRRAAQSLGAWREEMSSAERGEIKRIARARECKRADEAERKVSERRARIDARDHLHAVQTLYEEAVLENDWAAMSELLPRMRQCEDCYCRLAGLEVPA